MCVLWAFILGGLQSQRLRGLSHLVVLSPASSRAPFLGVEDLVFPPFLPSSVLDFHQSPKADCVCCLPPPYIPHPTHSLIRAFILKVRWSIRVPMELFFPSSAPWRRLSWANLFCECLWALWWKCLQENADFPSACDLQTFTFSPVYSQLASTSSPITAGKLFWPNVPCISSQEPVLTSHWSLHTSISPHAWGQLVTLWPEHSEECNKRQWCVVVLLASFCYKFDSDTLASTL